MDSTVRSPEEIYQVGDLCIDVGRHRVTRAGVEVRVPKLSFELLLALVRAHPRMLTTEELLDIVWAPAVVTPETVGQRVKLLRQALGDDPRAPRYVVGVRGLGYRIDVPVTREERTPNPPALIPDAPQLPPVSPSPVQNPTAASAAPPLRSVPSAEVPIAPRQSRQLHTSKRAWALGIAGCLVVCAAWYLSHSASREWPHRVVRALPLRSTRETQVAGGRATGRATTPQQVQSDASLAVLPFVDMSPQHDQQYFSDGLAEELLNRLAQLPALRVTGRTSSFAFRGRNDDLRTIGAALNVKHVLEGSVRKEGNRVRVAVQLVDTSDGSYVWSQTYERTLDDIFAIQEDIGRAVATELQLKLNTAATARGGTRNFAAFDEFLTARALMNSNVESSVSAATAHFERAVTLDPGYLDAWIWLIDSYERDAAGDVKHRAALKQAQQEAIAKVSAVAPGSVYAAIADSYGALADGRLQDAGRLLEATLDATQGIRARVRMRYGQFLLSVGRSASAVDQLTQTRVADPLDIFVRTQLVVALEVNGQLDRADAEAAQLRQLPGGDALILRGDQLARAMGRGDRRALEAALSQENNAYVQRTGSRVGLIASLDDPRAALRQLRSGLEDPRTSSDLFRLSPTMIWAAYLGDPELALRAAHRAAKLGTSFEIWAWTIWRPVMKDVRRRPEFKAVVQELGLVDYWRATGNWGDFCKPVGSNDFECT